MLGNILSHPPRTEAVENKNVVPERSDSSYYPSPLSQSSNPNHSPVPNQPNILYEGPLEQQNIYPSQSPFTEDYVVPRLIYDPNILYEDSPEQSSTYPSQSPVTRDYVAPRPIDPNILYEGSLEQSSTYPSQSPFTRDYVAPRPIYDPNILYEGSPEQSSTYPSKKPFH
jgi:hypothetical protein